MSDVPKCPKCHKDMQTTPICCECGVIPVAELSFVNLERERDAALRRVKELEGTVTRLVELVAECGECPPNTGICTITITCEECIREWAKGEPK